MTKTAKVVPTTTTATAGVDGQNEKNFVIELFHYDDGSIDYFTYDEHGNGTITKEKENAFRFLTSKSAMNVLAKVLTVNGRKFARYHFQNDYPLISEC